MMEEWKSLPDKQTQSALGRKFGTSLFVTIVITVLSFSFVENTGWALLASTVFSVLAIKKIYSLDNEKFKDDPDLDKIDSEKNHMFSNNAKHDSCDFTDPRNYLNPCSPYYRGNQDHH